PEFQHTQPFWFYLPILLMAFVPWVATMIWSAWIGLRIPDRHPLILLVLSWSGFCIAFFSISRSKLPGYILPAVPPIGLLLARSIQSLGPLHIKSFRRGAAVGALVFAIASLAFFEIARLTAPHSPLSGRAGTAYALLVLLFALTNLSLVF